MPLKLQLRRSSLRRGGADGERRRDPHPVRVMDGLIVCRPSSGVFCRRLFVVPCRSFGSAAVPAPFLYGSAQYLAGNGHARSVRAGRAVDRAGQPLPW